MRTESSQRVHDELTNGLFISVIKLIDACIIDAYVRRVSDIHIDPETDGLRVRMRADGLLEDAYVFPRDVHAELIARLKILSGLRTDEHFMPQDGRFRFTLPDATWVDIRISIAPTFHGENAALRLLTSRAEQASLSELGMCADDEHILKQALARSTGLIIVTGPTGSGKTTTLYTLMRILAKRSISLVTIEDPIEYSMPGVSQIQANQRTGLTFAKGLRSILRQDPDVLMVGEIRDGETAGLATNAALTGHLVLSTLHTNDAVSTLPRLLDMGVESYLIACTVRLIIAQRLVRRICSGCKEEIDLTPEQRVTLFGTTSDSASILSHAYKGIGCDLCNGTGYAGRLGVYELLPISEQIQEAISRHVTVHELRTLAEEQGMRSMTVDGISKIASGETTIEEILRIRYE
jgi:type II secretory ATPase GspE/PulE/Tfp pilus assembly ATPase PilB-like protein